MDHKKIVVIKVGSQIVAQQASSKLQSVAHHINHLLAHGYLPVLVSSGAVATGRKLLSQHTRLQNRKLRLTGNELKAAAAAVGQDYVTQLWKQHLSHPVAQVLVDEAHFTQRRKFVQIYRLIEKLLTLSLVPVINENDALIYQSNRLGNNDLLAAHISNMMGARWLFLITEVGGIYRDYPLNNHLIKTFNLTNCEQQQCIANARTAHGTGGMHSKIKAAEIAAHKNCTTVITAHSENLLDVVEGGSIQGTKIEATGQSLSGEKLWLSEISEAKGQLIIDQGACDAITFNSGSLLLPGVRTVTGNFEKNQVVEILNRETGQTIGKGIARLASNNLYALIREASKDARNHYSCCQQQKKRSVIVIHRNQLVLCSY